MLTKNQKHIIVIIISFIVSAIIWQINASWGNTFWVLLIASILTFLTVFAPFEIYFAARDIWFDRWNSLHSKDLEISKIKIKLEEGFLYANLVEAKDREVVKSKKTLIVISHGFSDTKETLQYLYFPLAYQGFSILSYDARGIGESKSMGHRGDFLKRIEDFKMIIEWIKREDAFKSYKIYALGMSIGALTALCAGFPNKDIEKIVAISSMSQYKQSISTSNLIVKFIYFLKGVDISPNDEINQQLSPYIVLEKIKSTLSPDDWEKLSKRVLLIHSRNDKVIPFLNFEENKSLLELSEENVLVLRKGGHMQKKNEVALVGAVLKFFNL